MPIAILHIQQLIRHRLPAVLLLVFLLSASQLLLASHSHDSVQYDDCVLCQHYGSDPYCIPLSNNLPELERFVHNTPFNPESGPFIKPLPSRSRSPPAIS